MCSTISAFLSPTASAPDRNRSRTSDPHSTSATGMICQYRRELCRAYADRTASSGCWRLRAGFAVLFVSASRAPAAASSAVDAVLDRRPHVVSACMCVTRWLGESQPVPRTPTLPPLTATCPTSHTRHMTPDPDSGSTAAVRHDEPPDLYGGGLHMIVRCGSRLASWPIIPLTWATSGPACAPAATGHGRRAGFFSRVAIAPP